MENSKEIEYQHLAKHFMLHASQVNMYPGSDEAGNALVRPGPPLEDAPHVEIFFLAQPEDWQDGELTWIRPSHLDDAELQRTCMPCFEVSCNLLDTL